MLSNYNFGYSCNLLFVMSHDASVTAETLLEKHLEYGLPRSNLGNRERGKTGSQ